MKHSGHLVTGSKVVLNCDLNTVTGLWPERTEATVDGVYRKDGVERIYVKLGSTVLALDKSVLDNLPEGS